MSRITHRLGRHTLCTEEHGSAHLEERSAGVDSSEPCLCMASDQQVVFLPRLAHDLDKEAGFSLVVLAETVLAVVAALGDGDHGVVRMISAALPPACLRKGRVRNQTVH